MLRFFLFLCIFIFSVIGSGCSSVAPQYSASIENVQRLKDAGNVSAKISAFVPGNDLVNEKSISLRGSSLLSPYNGSYSSYLTEAIKQELELAGKLASGADVDVTGVLLKNDLNAAGIVTGYGDIEARFVVKKNGLLLFDKIKTAHTEWDSSFAGAIAIPRAQQEYPRLVQKLLSELYFDQEFMRSLK